MLTVTVIDISDLTAIDFRIWIHDPFLNHWISNIRYPLHHRLINRSWSSRSWCLKYQLPEVRTYRYILVSLRILIYSRFLSPLVAALLTSVFLLIVCRYVLNEKIYSFHTRMSVLSVISGIVFAMIVFLTTNLVYDGLILLRGL